MNSTDKTHGKMGHLCSSLCGAAMLREQEEEYVSRCPACGEPIDYCQGHGEIGDPAGFAVLQAHDDGIHAGCSLYGCDEAAKKPETIAVRFEGGPEDGKTLILEGLWPVPGDFFADYAKDLSRESQLGDDHPPFLMRGAVFVYIKDES